MADQKGFIYKIFSTKYPGLSYIGSTLSMSIKKRFNLHKSQYNRYLQGKANSISLYQLFDKYNINTFVIQLIKEYDVVDKKQLQIYEALTIFKNRRGIFRCVNKNIPFYINTLYQKQYKRENKERLKIYQRNYVRQHRKKK